MKDPENSIVSTQASRANGGSLDLSAQSQVTLRDSSLITVAQGGSETVGGDIRVAAPFLILDDSQVIANAPGTQGANVLIPEGVFIASPDSVIQATGTIEISALIADLSGQLTRLSSPFTQAQTLLRNHCETRLRGGSSGRFVIRPRDRVPFEPGAVLPSPTVEGTATLGDFR